MAESVQIARGIITQMLEEARRNITQECCGLLAGRAGAITNSFPARNAHVSPSTSFEIAPADLFTLFREMRAQGLDFLGICHSHPKSENVPSPTDIERAYYPDIAYFIVSPAPGALRPVRAFHIRDGRAVELSIEEV